MKFKDIVAISGMSGLYEMMKQRPDGMVVRSLQEEKSRFVSNRIHTFSPLETIAIYTDNNDSVELKKVMQTILAKKEEIKIPSAKAKSPDLKAFFKQILENYDEERVYVSDIKKVIKWFNLLKEYDLIADDEEEEEEAATEEQTEATTEEQAETATAEESSTETPAAEVETEPTEKTD